MHELVCEPSVVGNIFNSKSSQTACESACDLISGILEGCAGECVGGYDTEAFDNDGNVATQLWWDVCWRDKDGLIGQAIQVKGVSRMRVACT